MHLEYKRTFAYVKRMARTKTISDTALLDLLLATVQVHGPAGLSFAKAAAASGLAAATLVQRFGNRDGMLEAILLRAWDLLDEATETAMAEAGPGATGAVDVLLRLTHEQASDQSFGDGLLLLREDFSNPVLRARGARWGTRLAEALGNRLSPDAAHAVRLGWQMASLWQGTLLWWGFSREGSPRERVKQVLLEWCDGQQRGDRSTC
ncbi:hypothetical protein [Stenotrophomonas lactitubi]|uniref:hypothetical protein n=1 Tax=Stenotrophomonas lactitubi TaxID=2045214 RepID=UPI001E446820|nr:hypothetical protein [Stenotrophomonas lactitubi]